MPDRPSVPEPAEAAIRVTFLIRSLETGGAERQLVALAKGLDRRRFAPSVVTLYPGGALEAELAEAGVPFESLDKRGRWDLLGPLRRLRAILRRSPPAVLHAFLTMGNLFALAARGAAPEAKLVWGWRASALDHAHYGPWLHITERLELALARRPALIVANAEAGRRDRVAQGAPSERIAVVPNGIDCARFRPDPAARARLRAEWGLAEETPLIGLLARLDPMKGHGVFLEAAALALRERPALRFVAIGGGTERRAALEAQAAGLGLTDRVIWAGERRDAAAVLAALDLHCSASLFGEGFSNAVAESMAAGVPNVVTDVGDSAAIVGDCGLAVPPNDPAALARGWLALLERSEREGEALRSANRRRIESHFSVETMVSRSAQLYCDLIESEA